MTTCEYLSKKRSKLKWIIKLFTRISFIKLIWNEYLLVWTLNSVCVFYMYIYILCNSIRCIIFRSTAYDHTRDTIYESCFMIPVFFRVLMLLTIQCKRVWWSIDKSLAHKYLNPITFAILSLQTIPSFRSVAVFFSVVFLSSPTVRT